MSRTIHFCMESYDPLRGGMEASALRIAACLRSVPGNRVVLHSIEGGDGIPSDISRRVTRAFEPLRDEQDWIEAKAELYRLRTMFLRNSVARDVSEHSGDHVLLSFFLTTAGFIAQNVAFDLELPHVAASRGSDLGRDLFSPVGFARVEYVLRHATAIVTTNRQHERHARTIARRPENVRTIYNPLPPGVGPVWRPSGAPRVRLVTLGGYSMKKGTHLLVESVRQLADDGLPVELTIAGPQAKQGYWSELRRALQAPVFCTNGMLGQEEVESFLLSGDVFCSASLSEGCSNVTMTALGLGMPIVSTATGSLPDLAANLAHVRMAPPGEADAFTGALRDMVQSIAGGSLEIDAAAVREASAGLSAETEQARWQEVLEGALLQ